MFFWVQPRVQYSTMPYTVQYKCYWKHIWLWMQLEYPPQLRYRCRSSTSCQWRLIPKNVISLWLHIVGPQTCIYSGTWRHLLLQMKNTIVSHVKRTTSFPTAWMYWLLVHPAKIFRGWIKTEPVSLGVPWTKKQHILHSKMFPFRLQYSTVLPVYNTMYNTLQSWQ